MENFYMLLAGVVGLTTGFGAAFFLVFLAYRTAQIGLEETKYKLYDVEDGNAGLEGRQEDPEEAEGLLVEQELPAGCGVDHG